MNTNAILADYGVYQCDEALIRRGLKSEGPAFAANHSRAILDLLYQIVQDGRVPKYLYGACEDFLDSEDEKRHLIERASLMLPYLESEHQTYLLQWINHERGSGYRS